MDQRLKMDILTSYGDECIYQLVSYLQSSANPVPAKYIRSGQKRIVWAADDIAAPYVYKMPYNTHGVLDNAIEFLFYKTLLALRDGGAISNDDLSLFTKIEIVNNDLFKIKAERADYIATNMPTTQTNIAEYILQNPNYAKDYNRIQEILGDYFVAYDATIYKEPMNYGIINRNGTSKLVLIDAGSILPKINMITNQTAIVVKCPECGAEMTYVRPEVHAGYIKDILVGNQSAGATYICSNHYCKFHEAINAVNVDIHVYNRYLEQNRAIIDAIIAAYTGFYIPDGNKSGGMPYAEYRNRFIQICGSMGESVTEQQCVNAFAMYIDQTGAFMLNSRADIANVIKTTLQRMAVSQSIPYSAFRQDLSVLGVQPLYCAWCYISTFLGDKDRNDNESWSRFLVFDRNVQRSLEIMRGYFNELGVPPVDNELQLLCNDMVII
jgi:hypothetical protein